MSLNERKLNRLNQEKKKKMNKPDDLEFSNDFVEDTCGADVFLLKKLPQMYNPDLENEVEFQLKDLLGGEEVGQTENIHKTLK